jgi:hypothetical protein
MESPSLPLMNIESKTSVQPQLFRLVRMLVQEILAEAFPDETAAARVQQIGIFTIIFMLQGDGEPVTAARVAAVSGLAQSHVSKQLPKLLKVGIVERTAITSPHGRGRAWHLSIKHSPKTKTLLDALLAGAKGSAKRKQ